MKSRQWAHVPRTRAELLTLALTIALAAAATTATVLDAHTPATLAPHVPKWVMFVALAAMFGLGEQLPMVIEFRRQAHTITVGGPALVIGALMTPVPVVVLARLVGAGLALAYQRKSPTKWAYNAASFSCEAALITTLVHRFVGVRSQLDFVTMLTLLGVVVAVDQLIS